MSQHSGAERKRGRRAAGTGRIAHFIAELRRRRVLSFTAGYIVTAWVFIEAASVVLQAFEAPHRILQILIIAVVALAPAAMVLAWFYDFTFHGLVYTDKEDWKQADSDPATATSATPVAAVSAEAELPAAAPPPGTAERRLVTVLRCSVWAAGDDSSDRQLEAFRSEMPSLARRFAEIVDGVEGHLLPAEGEVFTAYFGVSIAHEDDSMRAVVAAQRMLRHVAERNAAASGPAALRVAIGAGLHCGFAVVEELPGRAVEQWVSNIGPTLNGAAAMQLAAGDGEIRLSQNVRAMLHERLPCESVGQQPLPGSAAPVAVYRILGTDVAPLAASAAFVGDMIGREQELALLGEKWRSARDGEGGVILLRGEAGMGKTRLVARFREMVAAEGDARTIVLQCSAYHAHSPLFPVLRYVEQCVPRYSAHDDAAARERSLAAWLDGLGLSHPELPRILGETLSQNLQAGASQVEPGKQKELLLQALLSVLLEGATKRPALLLVEDLHWADPTSLELLGLLVGQVPALKALLLLTTRPGFRAPWAEQSDVQLVTVNRLNRAQSRAIVAAIDRERAIDEPLAEAIVAKADGVPLFVEELTRSVIEAARRNLLAGSRDPLTIPNTLQESLAARIQHLGAARGLLQLASAVGRESGLALLQAAAGLPAERVEELMDQLVDRELVLRRGVGAHTTYTFRHALIQEAAYASMLKSRREECHLAVAQALENDGAIGGHGEEVLAYHYAAAATTPGHARLAIRHWLAAAQVAVRRSANIEADHFLDGALQQLEHLPAGDERDETELRLQVQRIPVLVALHGYSSERMARATRRALELCESVRTFDLRFMALFSVCVFDMVAGRHRESFESARKLARLDAENGGSLLVETEMLQGLTCFFLGQLEESERHLGASIAAYDRDAHGAHAYTFGQDPEIVAMSYLAWVLFCRGESGRLAANEQRLLERAHSLNHPNSLGFALAWAGWTRVMGGDHAGLAEIDAELGALGAQYGLTSFAVQAQVLEALRQCRSGNHAAGLPALEQGIGAWRSIGSRCFQVCWDVQFARACLDAGQPARAGELLARAAAAMAATEERWSESDLHRCLARLALQTGDRSGALVHLRDALAAAERQHAWGWYLAVACDAAEIMAANEPDAARDLLDGALARLPGPPPGEFHERARAVRAALA